MRIDTCGQQFDARCFFDTYLSRQTGGRGHDSAPKFRNQHANQAFSSLANRAGRLNPLMSNGLRTTPNVVSVSMASQGSQLALLELP
ncbi:hypothetical protein MD273_04335 [Marinobacter pelagius]|nr:hypothetical protein [Marinobacter sp. C7]